jgi:formylmethanofuran dehydrogenase subunit D
LQDAQAIIEGDVGECRIHPDTLRSLGIKTGERVKLKQGDHHAVLIAHEDARIAKQAIWAAAAIDATQSLGGLFDVIELEKA